MAKSKNHTNHNQNFKHHKNGIKPVADHRYPNQKCVNQTYLKNKRRAMKFDPSIKKDQRLQMRIQRLRTDKNKIIEAVRNKLIAKNKKKPVKADDDKKEAKAKTKK